MAQSDRVRVIRVLEYEGPREWVETTLAANAVKGTKDLGNGCVIREAIVGDFPVVIESLEEVTVEPTAREIVFLERFGWDFTTDGGAIKRDITTGKVLAREGDETWVRDLRVVGE